jgi:hypothetical protein
LAKGAEQVPSSLHRAIFVSLDRALFSHLPGTFVTPVLQTFQLSSQNQDPTKTNILPKNNSYYNNIKMYFSTSIATIFFGLSVTSSSAFSPAAISNSITSSRISNKNKGTQLNYIREVEMHGVSLVLDSSLSNTSKIKDCLSLDNDDDDKDPMEEAFDSMQHPMELLLLSRACIPYAAM